MIGKKRSSVFFFWILLMSFVKIFSICANDTSTHEDITLIYEDDLQKLELLMKEEGFKT